jgi:hypothetical protein
VDGQDILVDMFLGSDYKVYDIDNNSAMYMTQYTVHEIL